MDHSAMQSWLLWSVALWETVVGTFAVPEVTVEGESESESESEGDALVPAPMLSVRASRTQAIRSSSVSWRAAPMARRQAFLNEDFGSSPLSSRRMLA